MSLRAGLYRARALYYRAHGFVEAGRLEEAELLYRSAIAVFESNATVDRAEIVAALGRRAAVLRRLDRGDEAAEIEARREASEQGPRELPGGSLHLLLTRRPVETGAIDRIAASLFAANRTARTLPPAARRRRAGDAGRRLPHQDRLSMSAGDGRGRRPPVGHKIALTSKAVQDLCGVDTPAYGVVFSLRESPAVVAASDFQRLGLDRIEVAASIRARRAPCAARHTTATASPITSPPARRPLNSSTTAAPITTTSTRRRLSPTAVGAPAPLSAPGSPDWRRLDLAAAPATLAWNGETADRATTGASMGHPFEGLAWIANHLAERGRALSGATLPSPAAR